MKKLILLAGIASLAACGGGADDVATDNVATDDTAMTTDDTAMAADATAYAGTHEVYDEEGNLLGTTTAMANGTYTDANADGSTAGGTYTVNESGQICFDENGDDKGPTCWTKGDTVDGKVRWTNPDGENVMVAFTPA